MGIYQYQLNEWVDWMSLVLLDLILLISYQDQVIWLLENVWVIVFSDFCFYVVYVIGDQVLCFQGYFEFVYDYFCELFELCQQYLGEEFYCKGVDSLVGDYQGIVVVEWMMCFVVCQLIGV